MKYLILGLTKFFLGTRQGQDLFVQLLPFLLTWALILGIPAVVICVTIGIACSGLPKIKKSQKKQRGNLIFWLHLYLITYWIATVLGIFCDPTICAEDVSAGNMTEDEALEVIGRWSLCTLIVGMVSWVCLYHFVVRLWSQIPKDIARITPQNAAWFSLIPVFNFYGWFVTFRGLLEDMNKTAQRYGQPIFVESGFAVGICIFWIGLVFVRTLFEPQGDFNLLLQLVNLIFTTAFFIYLYNNIVKLIAMEP
jgi:hypothetical protein